MVIFEQAKRKLRQSIPIEVSVLRFNSHINVLDIITSQTQESNTILNHKNDIKNKIYGTHQSLH